MTAPSVVWRRALEWHGRPGDLAADEPVLASCYGATAGDLQVLGADPGQRTQKVFGPGRHREPDSGVPVAEVGGINIHAATAVDGRDRRRLERLLRWSNLGRMAPRRPSANQAKPHSGTPACPSIRTLTSGEPQRALSRRLERFPPLKVKPHGNYPL